MVGSTAVSHAGRFPCTRDVAGRARGRSSRFWGCGSPEPVIDPGDVGEYSADVDRGNFLATIDNPWLPFAPGSQWVYEGRYGDNVERNRGRRFWPRRTSAVLGPFSN